MDNGSVGSEDEGGSEGPDEVVFVGEGDGKTDGVKLRTKLGLPEGSFVGGKEGEYEGESEGWDEASLCQIWWQ